MPNECPTSALVIFPVLNLHVLCTPFYLAEKLHCAGRGKCSFLLDILRNIFPRSQHGRFKTLYLFVICYKQELWVQIGHKIWLRMVYFALSSRHLPNCVLVSMSKFVVKIHNLPITFRQNSDTADECNRWTCQDLP